MTLLHITHFSPYCFQNFLESKEGENIQKIYIQGENISFGTNCFIRGKDAQNITFYVDTEDIKKELYGAITVTTIKSIEELQIELKELKELIKRGGALPPGMSMGTDNILRIGTGEDEGGIILNKVMAITPMDVGTEDGTSSNMVLFKSGARYYQVPEGKVVPIKPPIESNIQWEYLSQNMNITIETPTIVTNYIGYFDETTYSFLTKLYFHINSIYCSQQNGYEGEYNLFLDNYHPTEQKTVQNIDIRHSGIQLNFYFNRGTPSEWVNAHYFNGKEMQITSTFMNQYPRRFVLSAEQDIPEDLFEDYYENAKNVLAIFILGDNPNLIVGENAFKNCENCIVYITNTTFIGLVQKKRISLEYTPNYGTRPIYNFERKYRIDDAYIQIIDESILQRFNIRNDN